MKKPANCNEKAANSDRSHEIAGILIRLEKAHERFNEEQKLILKRGNIIFRIMRRSECRRHGFDGVINEMMRQLHIGAVWRARLGAWEGVSFAVDEAIDRAVRDMRAAMGPPSR